MRFLHKVFGSEIIITRDNVKPRLDDWLLKTWGGLISGATK